ncbi:hypothetical protein BGX23_008519 [Mortierella sp. AD031]|nr:hypothetical protein BGX23_008519 [Mortierella sp. AD031]
MEANTHIDPLTLPDIVHNIVPFFDGKQSLAHAALVCKEWNRIYTPYLWRNTDIHKKHDNAILNFERHGVHVRHLRLGSFEDSHFDLVAPFCPHVDRLDLWNTRVSFGRLVAYLRTNGPGLKRFQLNAAHALDRPERGITVHLDELVSLLATGAHRAGNGGSPGTGGPALEELELRFCIGSSIDLCLDTLEELLGACLVQILHPVPTANNDGRSAGLADPVTTTTAAATAVKEKQEVGNGLQDDGLVGSQSALTSLSLRGMNLDDRILLRLLERTPRLTSLALVFIRHLNGDFLDVLPSLCPELTRLNISSCKDIPSSVFARFFQTLSSPEHHSLALEYLHLQHCKVDDQSLHHLASTQCDTLLELTLRCCLHVTDSGVVAILSGCRRLTSLSLFGTPAVTVAIMMEDSPAERWSCYKSLERLRIRGLGVTEIRHRYWNDDTRIEQNPEAFQKIQKRVRMLPNLQELNVSVSGAEEELVQGFLGIEEQEEELEVGGAMRDDAVETADEIGNKRSTDKITGGAATTAGLSSSTARILVGPRLRTLRIGGLKRGGLVGKDIGRLLKNYPGLKDVYLFPGEDSFKEMKDRLTEAGIALDLPKESHVW